jgi:hypothetical protein
MSNFALILSAAKNLMGYRQQRFIGGQTVGLRPRTSPRSE